MRIFASFAGLAFLVASAAVSEQTPAAPAPGNTQKGKELYLKYSCYACHGYDGHGGAGARLVPLAMTVTRFTAYVHNPRRMPPYTEKVLSDAQLADLFAYIKSLPVSPPADQIPLLSRIMSGK
jgi:ubiquinol-cytochrome c reductase cytochrome c subunit